MHIFFSGIGGSGIGPLALIAKQAGFEVSGSDKQESDYTHSLQKQGVDLYIGQTTEAIAALHAKKPIDWLVYSSSIPRENPNHPEILFAQKNHIKISKRDELLSQIITKKHLKLLGIAGTHGKSTTTAMVIWLFKQLGVPIGHSVGAKIGFAPMGQLQPDSQFFVYECDEFDRNFLAFNCDLAVITGISWDHHEIFSSRQDYYDSFKQFITQAKQTIIWQDDQQEIGLSASASISVTRKDDANIKTIQLVGEYNRQDAWQAILAVHEVTKQPIAKLVAHINSFPGLKQRMELIAPNLYSNYAHTPEKIKAGMATALELAQPGQNLIVIYEPLTNRRQHFIKNDYKNCFEGANKIYWVPTYLAREDPDLAILSPQQLIPYISNNKIAEPASLNNTLQKDIQKHLKNGDLVIAMGASGAGSLDEWLRARF